MLTSFGLPQYMWGKVTLNKNYLLNKVFPQEKIKIILMNCGKVYNYLLIRCGHIVLKW